MGFVRFGVCVGVFGVSAAVAGTVTINEQVRLVDGTGTPLSGPMNVEVRLMDDATPGAPEQSCHTETITGAEFQDGYASLRLASVPTSCFLVPRWVSISVGSPFSELLPRTELGAVPVAAVAHQVPTAASPSGCSSAGELVYDTVASSMLVCDGAAWQAVGNSVGLPTPGMPTQIDRSSAPGSGATGHDDGTWDDAGPDGTAALGSPATAVTGNTVKTFSTGQRRRMAPSSTHDGNHVAGKLFDGSGTAVSVNHRPFGSSEGDKQVVEFYNPLPMWVDSITLRSYPNPNYHFRHARLERWDGFSWILVDEYGPDGAASFEVTLGGTVDPSLRTRHWRIVTQDGVNNANYTTDVQHLTEVTEFLVTEYADPVPDAGSGTTVDRSQGDGAGTGSHSSGAWDYAASTSGGIELGGVNMAPTADNVRFFTSGANRAFTVSSQYPGLEGHHLFDGSQAIATTGHFRVATGGNNADKQVIEFYNPAKMWVTGITLHSYNNPAYFWRHAALERWDGTNWVEVDEFGPQHNPFQQNITLGMPADYANRSHSWRVVIQDGLSNSNGSGDVIHITEVRPMMVVEYAD